MKIYTATGHELDERLELDKRQNSRAFCVCFNSLEEAPDEFYDLQSRIVDRLEEKFAESFGDDGVDRSQFESWEMPTYEWFCFNTDMIGSERIEVEIADNILGDRLLGIVVDYLERVAPQYCVVAEVYKREIVGENYIGRFVVTIDEIAIEESLVTIWTKQVKSLEIAKSA